MEKGVNWGLVAVLLSCPIGSLPFTTFSIYLVINPVVPASTSNFDFLHDEFPVLYTIGKEAEFQVHHDPAAALFKLSVFGEKLVNRLFSKHHFSLIATTHGTNFTLTTPSIWGHFLNKQERGVRHLVQYLFERV